MSLIGVDSDHRHQIIIHSNDSAVKIALVEELLNAAEPLQLYHLDYANNTDWTDYFESSANFFERFVISTCVLTSLCLISFVTAVMLLIWLIRDKTLKSTTRFMLCVCASNDIVLMVVYSVVYGPLNFVEQHNYIHYFVIMYGSVLFITLRDVAVWLLLGLVVHQYLDIFKPLFLKRHVTTLRACLLVVALYISCGLYRLPFCLEYRIESYDMVDLTYITNTELAENFLYTLIYKVVCVIVFELVVPFSLLVAVTVPLARAAARRSRGGVNNNHAGYDTLQSTPLTLSHEEASACKLVALLSLTGMICLSPPPIYHVHLAMLPHTLTFDAQEALHLFVHVMTLLYPASKLIIYLVVARCYRAGTTACCRGLPKWPPLHLLPPPQMNQTVVETDVESSHCSGDVAVFLPSSDRCLLVKLDTVSLTR